MHGPLGTSPGQLSGLGQEGVGLGQGSPRFWPLPASDLKGDVTKAWAGRGLPSPSLPRASTSSNLSSLHRELPQQPLEGHRCPLHGERGYTEALAPSAYLMLKPVVWSSLSQLCSFASSL